MGIISKMRRFDEEKQRKIPLKCRVEHGLAGREAGKKALGVGARRMRKKKKKKGKHAQYKCAGFAQANLNGHSSELPRVLNL